MNKKTNIYFIGVGGIGMSALARYFKLKGFNVAGYDLTKTELTEKLDSEGIAVSYVDDFHAIPEEYKNSDKTLVVITPAIPMENRILHFFKSNDFEIVKRAVLLGEVTRMEIGIAVAGTHGKTSISTFTSHLLYQSQLKCNAFLGGISTNYGTNLLFHEHAKHVVVEADEYDRSFLQLNPTIALISSMDADHLDIYGSHENIIEAFKQFAQLTFNNNGVLVVHQSVQHYFLDQPKTYSYGLNPNADFHPVNVQYVNGQYLFDLKTPDFLYEGLALNLSGTYNFENVIAASALSIQAGIDKGDLVQGLKTLKGVGRRFEILLRNPTLYIDDYAHHPVEINACISSAKKAFPEKKITIAFQPHLYSRTKDFYLEFSVVLNQADFVFLLPIYPAREKPLEGVSSALIASELSSKKCAVVSKEQLLAALSKQKPELFISMGAGDIGQFTKEIINQLKI